MICNLSPSRMGMAMFGLLCCLTTAGPAQTIQLQKPVLGMAYQQERPAASTFLPLRILNGREIKLITIAGISAFFVSYFDAAIDREYALFDRYRGIGPLKSYGRIGELYDRSYSAYIIAGGLAAAYSYSRFAGKPAAFTTARLMAEALLKTAVVTLSLKAMIGRHRPYTGSGPGEFELLDFYLDSKYHSFPSGHTSSIFALMTVLAKRSGSRWLSATAYSFAVSVAFQRMLDRKHWASDVIAGGVIGYLAASRVVYRHLNKKNRLHLAPYTDGRRIGVGISF